MYTTLAKTLVKEIIENVLKFQNHVDFYEITDYLEKTAMKRTASKSVCDRPYNYLKRAGIETTNDVKNIIAILISDKEIPFIVMKGATYELGGM